MKKKKPDEVLPMDIIYGKDEDFITPERAGKGDYNVTYNKDGKIKSAVPKERYVVKELIKLGHLEAHHEIYGLGFLEIKTAYYAPWNAKRGAWILANWGHGVSVSDVAGIYQNVRRQLGKRGTACIEFALEAEIFGEDPGKVRDFLFKEYSVGEYRGYFGKLVEQMDAERERIFKEKRIY